MSGFIMNSLFQRFTLASIHVYICQPRRFISNNITNGNFYSFISFVFWQRIYNLGARKFLVNNIPPAGCFPSKAIRARPRGKCDEKINKAISFYNRRLPEVLHELQSKLPGFSFVHADLFGFFKELRETGKSYGKKKSQMANQRAFESFWELLCRKCVIFMVKKLRIMLPWLVSKQNPN